jgi:ABC-type polysaccharide/polyol phosphate export permease
LIPKAQSLHVYDSAHQGSPALDELREVIRYRDLVIQMARRDILTRYKRSALGVAWTMLNPLGTMLILTIAFSRAFGTTHGYAAYVLSGLVAWTFFAQTTNAAITHLVWGGGLMKRIYVPRTVFAIAAIGTGLVNLLLSVVPILVVMLVTGVTIRWTVIFLPISMLFLALFSLGVGLLVSAVAVYFTDVAEMYQIVLTAWMYLTPIIYPESILPEAYRYWITRLNPMYHLVRMFRMPIYEGRIPEISEIILVVALSLVMLVVSWFFFTKKADEFAYRI